MQKQKLPALAGIGFCRKNLRNPIANQRWQLLFQEQK